MFYTYPPFAHIAWLSVVNTTLSAQQHRYRSSSHNGAETTVTTFSSPGTDWILFQLHHSSINGFFRRWTARRLQQDHHDGLTFDSSTTSSSRVMIATGVRGARSQVTPVRGNHLGFWINIFSNLPVINYHFFNKKTLNPINRYKKALYSHLLSTAQIHFSRLSRSKFTMTLGFAAELVTCQAAYWNDITQSVVSVREWRNIPELSGFFSLVSWRHVVIMPRSCDLFEG